MSASARSTRADVRSRIVDAAARLLRDEGPSAVTTRGVSDAAGVQAPTIYRHFGDKDGLLEAVAEHALATYVDRKREIADVAERRDGDPVDDLRESWRDQIAFALANPFLFRYMIEPGRRSAAMDSGMRVLRGRVARVASAGRLLVDEDRAIDLIHAAGVGTILALLSSSDRGDGAPPDDGLAEHMLDAVLASIVVDAPVPVEMEADIASRVPGLSDAERDLLREWLRRE